MFKKSENGIEDCLAASLTLLTLNEILDKEKIVDALESSMDDLFALLNETYVAIENKKKGE